jgi:hypothetical protein
VEGQNAVSRSVSRLMLRLTQCNIHCYFFKCFKFFNLFLIGYTVSHSVFIHNKGGWRSGVCGRTRGTRNVPFWNMSKG